jgi:hypothetical protein
MSILPSELRSLSSSGGDISALTATALQFRGLTGASIVCDKPAPSTLDLPPADLASNVLTSWSTQPMVGDTLYAFDEGASRGAEDDSWIALRITGFVASTAPCPGAPYTDPIADAGKRRFRVTVAQAIPATVQIGAGVRFYRHMRYELTQSSQARWYLGRSELAGGVWSTPTLISGPYEAPNSGGIKLRYFDSTGVEINNVAGANGVARIDLTLRAKGAAGSKASQAAPQDSLSFRIALRNRQ